MSGVKIQKTFHFLSGLPRSGSTVLTSILNQNPEVYATPTSPLLDQLITNQNVWRMCQAVKAHSVQKQLDNITKRLINAIYSHIPQDIIIDKCRGWGKNMPASTILFGREVKVVATTRDIPGIMASWMRLFQENSKSHMDQHLIDKGIIPTDETRTIEMWNVMVEDCVDGLQCLKRDASNRLLLINYDELIANPKNTLEQVESFLELPKWNYDFENIINKTEDDDLAAWGLSGMHTIRPKLEKTAKNPEEVLGKKLFEKFAEIERTIKNGKYRLQSQ